MQDVNQEEKEKIGKIKDNPYREHLTYCPNLWMNFCVSSNTECIFPRTYSSLQDIINGWSIGMTMCYLFQAA